jgi:hypothetical protein
MFGHTEESARAGGSQHGFALDEGPQDRVGYARLTPITPDSSILERG